MALIKEYAELIVSVFSLLCGMAFIIYSFLSKSKALKRAKTSEEKATIINDIKSNIYGYITVAENLFSDIPKSGASKLLYVLKEVKNLCTTQGVEYDSEYWTEFINTIVDSSNKVQDEKALASEIAQTVELVKREVSYFKEETDNLFAGIPNNLELKIAYIVKLIATACDKHPVNVFGEYDWQSYVYSLYTTEKEVV